MVVIWTGFIWRGFGFLVGVIAFGCSLFANLVADSIAGKGYYEHHKWPLGIALLFAAAICWFVGNHFRKQPVRVVVDRAGREFALTPAHSFFLIPMHWWGPILGLCAMIAFASEFIY